MRDRHQKAHYKSVMPGYALQTSYVMQNLHDKSRLAIFQTQTFLQSIERVMRQKRYEFPMITPILQGEEGAGGDSDEDEDAVAAPVVSNVKMSWSGRVRTCDANSGTHKNLCCMSAKSCPFLGTQVGSFSCGTGITRRAQNLWCFCLHQTPFA